MDFSETQITEKQLSEMCTYYESQSKIARNLIRESLSARQKVKAKIAEDRERATALLQNLERLDEYEKIVKAQLEVAEKGEDPESLNNLKIITKYESMAREQREVWTKYEKEYEQLPMAKERRKMQVQVLQKSIQIKLLFYKIEEKNKILNMKNQFNKRRELNAVINFAKFMVEYKNQEKRKYELQSKGVGLKKKEQLLRQQIEELEQLKVNREKKINVVEKQVSVMSLPPPPMDFSSYIPEKDNSNNYDSINADTISMYSLTLEQEYMNNEADEADKGLSKSTKPSKMEESSFQNNGSQESNPETLMNINTDEFSSDVNEETVNPRSDKKGPSNIYNGESLKKNTQESVKKSGWDTNKKRASQNQVPENYSNCENRNDDPKNSHIRSERPIPTPVKMLKHAQVYEDNSNCENICEGSRNIRNINRRIPCSPKVAVKVQHWQQSFTPEKENDQQKMKRDPLRQQQQQQSQEKNQQQQYHQSQQQQHYQSQQPQPQHHYQFQYSQQKIEKQQLNHQQQQHPKQQQHHQYQQHHQQQQQERQYQQHQQTMQQQQLHQQNQVVQSQQQQQQLHQQNQVVQSQQQQQPQHQQMSWSPNLPQKNGEQNIQRNLTEMPQSNKPLIISNERVNYDTKCLFQKQVSAQMTKQQVTPMDTSYDEETLDAASQMNQQSHSASVQSKPLVNVQSAQLLTPPFRNINAESMMSDAMYSNDSFMNADNISSIIGSDITEPGGEAGLIRHIHGDPDNTSEEVVLDFDNIMSKFCSPLLQKNSNHRQPATGNENNPNLVQSKQAPVHHDAQEPTNRNFNIPFGQKKQSNPSQHLF